MTRVGREHLLFHIVNYEQDKYNSYENNGKDVTDDAGGREHEETRRGSLRILWTSQ